jgi:hypothetical protein
MDFERLERAWQSSANSLPEAAKTYLMEEMMETLKKRRRDFRNFTGLVGLVLALWTVKIAYDVIVDPFPFDATREWAAFPLLMLPWVALLFVRAQQKRHLAAFPDPYRSTPEMLRALIDENATALARTRWMAGITAVCVALLALMLRQLVSVGKMSEQNVLQGSILFGAIFAGIWLYYGWEYFRRLRPEGERLRRLLADVGNGEEPLKPNG